MPSKPFSTLPQHLIGLTEKTRKEAIASLTEFVRRRTAELNAEAYLPCGCLRGGVRRCRQEIIRRAALARLSQELEQ